MAPIARPWHKAQTATVGSDGTATISVTPGPAGRYDIDLTTVSLTNNTAKGVVCRIYRDSVAQLNQMESTKSGDGDSSSTLYHLSGSDVLLAVWSGATVGATAGIRIAGLYTPEM
jgi:hypothetical protein